jgi:hypothetical protein
MWVCRFLHWLADWKVLAAVQAACTAGQLLPEHLLLCCWACDLQGVAE